MSKSRGQNGIDKSLLYSTGSKVELPGKAEFIELQEYRQSLKMQVVWD